MNAVLQEAIETGSELHLHAQVVDDRAEFQAMEAEWHELLAESATNSLSLTHAWLSTWWETFQAGRQLALTCLRDDSGRLIAVAPLLSRKVRYRGLLSCRRLEFLASGENEADEIDSDYLDLIIRRGFEAAATARFIAAWIAQPRRAWEEIVLPFIPEQSPHLALLETAARQAGLVYEVLDRKPGVVIPLPATWEEYLAGRSSNARRNIQRERRKLENIGPLRFHLVKTPEEFDRMWPRFVELHQQRWEHEGKAGCFASELFTRFHRQLTAKLLPLNKVRLAVLFVGEQPVAMRFAFVHERRVYCYQSGRDPRFDHIAVGNVLMGFCLERAIQDGKCYYDFLKGVTPNKARWSKTLQYQISVRIARPGAKELLRGGIEKLAALRRIWRKQQPIRRMVKDEESSLGGE
jgi:CelD/BcsL family acetyltransferase involved in cellulose biosynthesis